MRKGAYIRLSGEGVAKMLHLPDGVVLESISMTDEAGRTRIYERNAIMTLLVTGQGEAIDAALKWVEAL